MRRIHCLVLALAASVCVSYACAQSSGYAINDDTLTPMTWLSGGAFTLESQIGQPVAGGTASAGSFQLKGGFTPQNTTRIFANSFEP